MLASWSSEFKPYFEELGPLAAAFALGVGVAALRSRLRPGAGRDGLVWVLVVLAPLICLVVRAIEGDIAKAFGLVGILALVRFRTPMREPADAVFVLISVAAGVVVAARGASLLPVTGIVALGLGAWGAHAVLRLSGRSGVGAPSAEVRLRCRHEALVAAQAALASVADDVLLLRAELGAPGSVGEVRYVVALRPGSNVSDLARALSAVEGVERVTAQAPEGPLSAREG